MKIPFKDGVKLKPVVNEGLDQLSRDKINIVKISIQPLERGGETFWFLVMPTKLTDSGEFEQCNTGALCQTEAEADESVEMLKARYTESIVVFRTDSFDAVGTFKNLTPIRVEHAAISKKDGSKVVWFARWREIDKATGEVKVIRNQETSNESEAVSMVERWLAEYKAEQKQANQSNAPKLSTIEAQDMVSAQMTALRRQWPRCFAIFDQRKNNTKVTIAEDQWRDAYLLDLVEQGYDIKNEKNIRSDISLIKELSRASVNHSNRSKSNVTDAAVYLIAFKWRSDGWCNLSDADIAAKLNDALKPNVAFTAQVVKKYRYRTLGLITKHLPGPSPKA